jgi:hypothetical protein
VGRCLRLTSGKASDNFTCPLRLDNSKACAWQIFIFSAVCGQFSPSMRFSLKKRNIKYNPFTLLSV